ncbi:hypothetical protein FACS189494_07800 [Spirochaetia bacterium]|nr:hypothetical protein FACS189494_07800 [Spirochaetia bacterium]
MKGEVLVKASGAAAVYLVFNNEKHHIPNPTVYNRLFVGWELISTTDEIVKQAPQGAALSDDACLIKGRNSDVIYLVTNGKKLQIQSMPDFDKAGFNMEKVELKNQSDVDAIPTGEPLSFDLLPSGMPSMDGLSGAMHLFGRR